MNNLNIVRDGWFKELSSEMWPGQAMTLEVEEVLHHGQSKYQDILVLQTKTWGRVLVLDGVIQCSQKDEFAYQEMIAFLPVNSHPNPEKVLVIGGGDGGVVRELVKHPSIKHITLCEIDEEVISVSKRFLPHMSSGFDNPKVTIYIGDGFEYMKQHREEFDVIITDSSDPVGPASSLFTTQYYELMKSALRPGGILCCQGECIWLHLDLIQNMQNFCRKLFPVVDFAVCSVPTYPCGQIGFNLCSLNKGTDFTKTCHVFTNVEREEMNLKYYNAHIHSCSFTLPEFARKVLKCESVEQNGLMKIAD